MVGRDGSTFVPLAFVECDESDTQVGPGVRRVQVSPQSLLPQEMKERKVITCMLDPGRANPLPVCFCAGLAVCGPGQEGGCDCLQGNRAGA